ncbi:MAG: hypothetical protein Q7S02_01875 [bacterium]|nr:hypothetical protein [bacterium]
MATEQTESLYPSTMAILLAWIAWLSLLIILARNVDFPENRQCHGGGFHGLLCEEVRK